MAEINSTEFAAPSAIKRSVYFDLTDDDFRSTAYPIKHNEIYLIYLDMVNAIWTPNEVAKLTQDALDYKHKLTVAECGCVDYVLAFFSSADGLVNVNLAERFAKEIPFKEAQFFYNQQQAMEDIHGIVYSILIDEIITDYTHRKRLQDSILHYPEIRAIAAYIKAVWESDAPLPERVFKMACIEGVVFQGCFCIIEWFLDRGLMPGLGHSNELISKDENLHASGACCLIRMMNVSLTREVAHAIVEEVTIGLGKPFIEGALPVDTAEMNSKLVLTYMKCMADVMLSAINQPTKYNVKQPFSFMNKKNMGNLTDFFVGRVAEYSKKKPRSDVSGKVNSFLSEDY